MKKYHHPKNQNYEKGDVFVIEAEKGVFVYGRVLVPHLKIQTEIYGGDRSVLCLYKLVDNKADRNKILPADTIHKDIFIADGEVLFRTIGRVIRSGYLNDSEKFKKLFFKFFETIRDGGSGALRNVDLYYDENFELISYAPENSIDAAKTRFLNGVFDEARRIAGLPILDDLPPKILRRLKSPDPQFILHFPWQPLEEFLAVNKMDLHMLEDALGELIEEAGLGYYDGRPPPEDDVHVDFQFFVHSPETFAGGVKSVAKWLRERKAPKEVVIEGYSPKKKVMALYARTIDNLK